jgi:tetratricopeptide (TPR) repeat protein
MCAPERLFFVASAALLTLALGCSRDASQYHDDLQSVPTLVAACQIGPEEEKALSLLAAGKQAEAEGILNKKLDRDPVLRKFASLAAVHDPQANKLLAPNLSSYRDRQGLLFLKAVCTRSRFEVDQAMLFFEAVAAIDATTAEGHCARLMIALDVNYDGARDIKKMQDDMKSFSYLVEGKPDNVPIRWMMAVQCRTWDIAEEGVRIYKKVLEKWNPGPVLVHQSYATLLGLLGRHEEALVERRIAVALERAPWSYDSLGNTLHHLKRFNEAYKAYAEAVRIDPKDPSVTSTLTDWASALRDDGRLDDAIAKCKEALGVAPNNWKALWEWGFCLSRQGKKREALAKCKQALAIMPTEPNLKALAADLEMQLAKDGR